MMLFAPGGVTQIATVLRQGFRTGPLGEFALTVLRTTFGAVLVAAAIILICELLGVRSFTDGAGGAETAKVFGLTWNRLAPLTWVIVVIIATAGILLLRIRTFVSGFHRIRSAIPARHRS